MKKLSVLFVSKYLNMLLNYLISRLLMSNDSSEMKRSGSSTSSLMRHLRNKHPSKLDEKHKETQSESGPLDSFIGNIEVCLHFYLFS